LISGFSVLVVLVPIVLWFVGGLVVPIVLWIVGGLVVPRTLSACQQCPVAVLIQFRKLRK
jgi:hypothetical protein